MNNLKYKGYTGVVEFDGESGVLFGHVIGLRDVITFQGDSVAEVIQAFHDSVDVYLEFCSERGESPEKPFSGQFVLRLDPNLHRAISHEAELQGASLNALIEGTLERTFGASETNAVGRKPAAHSKKSASARSVNLKGSGNLKSPKSGRAGKK